MKMPGTTIGILGDVLIELFGNATTKKIIIGERPGEKLHEVLVSKNEHPYAYEFSDTNFVVLPSLATDKMKAKYSSLPHMGTVEFSSQNTHQLNHQQLKVLLEAESWLFS